MLDERIAVLGEIRGATNEQSQRHGELLRLRDQRDDGTLIEVLNDGFVRLVDYMGFDGAIVQAARVSYGSGAKTVHDDRGLIRFMMRHRHTTPFEMCEVKFHVRVPMSCWRQWIRHRTATVCEHSTRYAEAIDSTETTSPEKWRLQSGSNKQGSCGYVNEWPEDWSTSLDYYSGMNVTNKPGDLLGVFWDAKTGPVTPGAYLSAREAQLQTMAREIYEERLALGVAREQARKDLPLSTYTEAYWKMDLHNLLHFLELRLSPHAQEEIRQYAQAIGQIVKELYPMTWEAFEDYRIDGMTLSAAEVQRIREQVDPDWQQESKELIEMTDREWVEFRTKVRRLGFESSQPESP
jgi:thymidylate synthase (FAD)